MDKKRKNSAWSEKTKRQEEQGKRREKRKLKAKRIKSQQESSSAAANPDNQLKRQATEMCPDDDQDDWAEFAREEKLAKRVRKGIVSQEEFDIEFGDLL